MYQDINGHHIQHYLFFIMYTKECQSKIHQIIILQKYTYLYSCLLLTMQGNKSIIEGNSTRSETTIHKNNAVELN